MSEKRKKRRKKLRKALRKDFLPPRRKVQDDGIHAKLNYQSIADAQRRSMSILMVFIVLFSFGFIATIYWISESDELLSKQDVENYSEYIDVIKKKVIVGNSENIEQNTSSTFTEEEKMLEDNTSMYWGVFFVRFLLVRVLIGLTLGIILAFLIRIYFRVRDDRAVNIHKEEALSTIQYVARGEWKLKSNSDNKSTEEVGFINDSTEEVGYINDKTADVLTTEKFLNTIPIDTLFQAPNNCNRKGKKGGGMDKELIETLKQIRTTLSDIEEELHGIRKDSGNNSSGG